MIARSSTPQNTQPLTWCRSTSSIYPYSLLPQRVYPARQVLPTRDVLLGRLYRVLSRDVLYRAPLQTSSSNDEYPDRSHYQGACPDCYDPPQNAQL